MTIAANQKKFGESIRKARMDLDISIREAAKRIGISPSYLTNLEQNIDGIAPDDQLIRKVSTVLDLNYNELRELSKHVRGLKSLEKKLSPADKNNIYAFYQIAQEKGITTSKLLELSRQAADAHVTK